jgi:hypothetical protein
MDKETVITFIGTLIISFLVGLLVYILYPIL